MYLKNSTMVSSNSQPVGESTARMWRLVKTAWHGNAQPHAPSRASRIILPARHMTTEGDASIGMVRRSWAQVAASKLVASRHIRDTALILEFLFPTSSTNKTLRMRHTSSTGSSAGCDATGATAQSKQSFLPTVLLSRCTRAGCSSTQSSGARFNEEDAGAQSGDSSSSSKPWSLGGVTGCLEPVSPGGDSSIASRESIDEARKESQSDAPGAGRETATVKPSRVGKQN